MRVWHDHVLCHPDEFSRSIVTSYCVGGLLNLQGVYESVWVTGRLLTVFYLRTPMIGEKLLGEIPRLFGVIGH